MQFPTPPPKPPTTQKPQTNKQKPNKKPPKHPPTTHPPHTPNTKPTHTQQKKPPPNTRQFRRLELPRRCACAPPCASLDLQWCCVGHSLLCQCPWAPSPPSTPSRLATQIRRDSINPGTPIAQGPRTPLPPQTPPKRQPPQTHPHPPPPNPNPPKPPPTTHNPPPHNQTQPQPPPPPLPSHPPLPTPTRPHSRRTKRYYLACLVGGLALIPELGTSTMPSASDPPSPPLNSAPNTALEGPAT